MERNTLGKKLIFKKFSTWWKVQRLTSGIAGSRCFHSITQKLSVFISHFWVSLHYLHSLKDSSHLVVKMDVSNSSTHSTTFTIPAQQRCPYSGCISKSLWIDSGFQDLCDWAWNQPHLNHIGKNVDGSFPKVVLCWWTFFHCKVIIHLMELG